VVFQRRGETLPRHPSQLYEMAIGIVIFLILYFFYKKYYTRVKDGMMLYSFVILYFTTRFFIEYVKEYQVLNSSFPFTMGQLLSAPLVLFGFFIFYKKDYFHLKKVE
jgi:prolipoprotein diacylglyceryltransferase